MKELNKFGETLHHTSWCRGYVSRKDIEGYQEYKGRFGKGHTRLRPSKASTKYCYIEYWIKEV